MSTEFITKFLWASLIAIGRANNLSDGQIAENLANLEISFNGLSEKNRMLEALKQEGIIKNKPSEA